MTKGRLPFVYSPGLTPTGVIPYSFPYAAFSGQIPAAALNFATSLGETVIAFVALVVVVEV